MIYKKVYFRCMYLRYDFKIYSYPSEKDISSMILDLADFQTEHGPESLRKLMIKIGSRHKMKSQIETICDDLRKVTHRINI